MWQAIHVTCVYSLIVIRSADASYNLNTFPQRNYALDVAESLDDGGYSEQRDNQVHVERSTPVTHARSSNSTLQLVYALMKTTLYVYRRLSVQCTHPYVRLCM